MRMHRKSHLDERLEACGAIVTLADLSDKNMKSAAEKKAYLNFTEIFGNDNPVHLEIGCGKGKFVLEMAKMYPQINFIAIEKVSNVIVTACEQAISEGIKNVHFINSSAEVLKKYFPDHSFQRIYLNFSNPLPKEGFKKQRLTHPKFLQLYKDLSVAGGELWQKTDNEGFFEFSLASYEEMNFKILSVCRDLKNHPFEGNVVTEHEQKFMDMGLPIFRAVVQL